MSKPTGKRIFLTRHAEAEHNVTFDWSIADAPLTPLGREQAAALHERTKDTIQADADLLVTSPFRRTLSTALTGYGTLRKRLEGAGAQVVVLPQLQEASDNPCDTGSPREALEANPEYAGLDFALLTPDWTSKSGFYAPDAAALAARARWVRRWLRERPERAIVVVSHGECLRYITHGRAFRQPWANGEVREYAFAAGDEGADEEAWLVEVKRVAQEGSNKPTAPAL